jgi:hypothetical protein
VEGGGKRCMDKRPKKNTVERRKENRIRKKKRVVGRMRLDTRTKKENVEDKERRENQKGK